MVLLHQYVLSVQQQQRAQSYVDLAVIVHLFDTALSVYHTSCNWMTALHA